VLLWHFDSSPQILSVDTRAFDLRKWTEPELAFIHKTLESILPGKKKATKSVELALRYTMVGYNRK